MGSAYSTMEQNHRVEDVIRKAKNITLMGLSGCADTLIGIPNSVKGLSCGEMKRLAFASEILTCPQILFCDEPTSGLDAFMAGHVVAALRALADGGMTVVITIHQPSSQVYSLFSDVCLMACGRIIYLGPTEEAHPLFERLYIDVRLRYCSNHKQIVRAICSSSMIPLLSSCGFPCPEYHNPADHLIRTLAIINGQRSTCLRTISRIRRGFLQTPHGKQILEISEKQVADKRYSDDGSSNKKDRSFFSMKYPASFLGQLSALTWRAWLTIVRDPMVLKIRLIQTIVCALITGFVYFGTPINSDTIMSINGILFNHVRNINFMLQFPAVPVITMELPIVLRENTNGIYTTTSYFLGKNIAELPQYIILPAIYNVIVYWMAGLVPNIWTFLFATLICALMTNVAISISYAVAAIFGSTDVAMTFLPIIVVPMMAFGGFFITYDAIPFYFKWLSQLSYFKYSYEALAINEWEMVDVIPGYQHHLLNDNF
ncbi:ABC-2 type transporter [Ancylostoma caninum]|uniref:ABC-2 type transporter n=1 Tax=Ancylostoma caninum TaxID=29170 RepID=A0A368G2Z6_ANCCA|nr:ABC-2 type transporter [Ancylostoma caninum]